MVHKQTKSRAHLIGDTLYTPDGMITVGSRAWYVWLQHNTAVYCENVAPEYDIKASFTARRETRNGINYWYAYSRVVGKLHKRFIGQSEDFDFKKLWEIARKMPTTKIS